MLCLLRQSSSVSSQNRAVDYFLGICQIFLVYLAMFSYCFPASVKCTVWSVLIFISLCVCMRARTGFSTIVLTDQCEIVSIAGWLPCAVSKLCICLISSICSGFVAWLFIAWMTDFQSASITILLFFADLLSCRILLFLWFQHERSLNLGQMPRYERTVYFVKLHTLCNIYWQFRHRSNYTIWVLYSQI